MAAMRNREFGFHGQKDFRRVAFHEGVREKGSKHRIFQWLQRTVISATKGALQKPLRTPLTVINSTKATKGW
jgi:hypothetical protein